MALQSSQRKYPLFLKDHKVKGRQCKITECELPESDLGTVQVKTITPKNILILKLCLYTQSVIIPTHFDPS